MRGLSFVLALLSFPAGFGSATAAPTESPQSVPAQAETASPAKPSRSGAIGQEIGRWGRDGVEATLRPLHWERHDWRRAAIFGAALGGFLLADHRLITTIQDHRSSFTDDLRHNTEWLGAWGAVALSGGLLATGLATGDDDVRDMGRDAIEASVLTQFFVGAFKVVSGRERPRDTNGETVFKPFGGGASSPRATRRRRSPWPP